MWATAPGIESRCDSVLPATDQSGWGNGGNRENDKNGEYGDVKSNDGWV